MKAAGATDEEIASVEMDGVEQWEIVKDPENFVSKRQDVVLNVADAPQGNHGPQGAYRKGQYKIVVHPSPQDGWIEPPTAEKYSQDIHTKNVTKAPQLYYLFNVVDDPEEREDLSTTETTILQEMTQAFLSLHDEMVPADEPEDASGGLQDGVWVTGWR
eukprot:TRINITY_DN5665_c0_g1_i4.p1 TRINITY_DN5665_c0_g1~~TRINITY_DN5665_c0_g1_i4.p1  ORF type:complete len:159 (+),score=54.23 TRINITY_DN5665_c0_g1_i4:125-601(+)